MCTRTYIHTFINTYFYIHIHKHTYIHAYNNPTVLDVHISSRVYHVLNSAYSVNRTAHTFRKMGSDGMQILIAGLGYTAPAFYTC
jgi:hypothetical protein